ncbi:response regulator [Candidatus Peregrinibacteria bacterium]|nr:response regulator [Candidatus Peregrinibacteria bacterium]
MIPIKILIVEDEGIVAKDLQHMLADMGYKILDVAVSGEEALEKVKKRKPDLVLMDIVLKGKIDGIETTRRLRTFFDIPVIYVTAYGDKEKIERAKTTEPYGYILKPFTKLALKADIEMALYNHKVVNELKASSRKIKKSLEEREVMLKEIHHRVKNNMQIISSLLSHQSRRTKNKKTIGLFSESQARIQSMMLIHENLYESKDFSSVDFAAYVKRLMEHLSTLYEVRPFDIDFQVKVKAITLDMNMAIPCGLILNELVTNAIKYAFSDSKKDKKKKKIIKVDMHSSGGKVILTVGDNGVGMPAKINLNKPTTLGLELITTLTRQLGGNLKLDRKKGTTFTISFNRYGKWKQTKIKNTHRRR